MRVKLPGMSFAADLNRTATVSIRLPFVVLLVLTGAAFAASLHAHAILLESSPAVHATVKGPDLDIRMRFNVRVDVIRSRFTLVYPDTIARPLSLDKQQAPDTVLSRVSGLVPGAYTIRWQVLAPDGHISRGEIPFKVGS